MKTLLFFSEIEKPTLYLFVQQSLPHKEEIHLWEED